MKAFVKLFLGLSLLFGVEIAYAETTVEYGITAVGQTLSKESDKVTTAGLGSIDLVLDTDIVGGTLHVYVEAASDTLGSASELIEGSNYDAGSVKYRETTGRAQLSEISYELDFISYSVLVGLRDLFSFVDQNSSSNDETSQFLSAPLVNNTTIAMPEYAPCAVLNYGYKDSTNMTFMVASGYGVNDAGGGGFHGLKEGYTTSGQKKGVFALAELRMVDQDVWLSVGAWTNTREAAPLQGSYLNLDSAANDDYQWSLRVAQNDEAVGMNNYGAFSVAIPFGDDALGLGLAVQKFAVVTDTIDHTTTFETYYRWQIADGISLTPDIQYWRNANSLLASDAGTGQIGGNLLVYGLRLQIDGTSTF